MYLRLDYECKLVFYRTEGHCHSAVMSPVCGSIVANVVLNENNHAITMNATHCGAAKCVAL